MEKILTSFQTPVPPTGSALSDVFGVLFTLFCACQVIVALSLDTSKLIFCMNCRICKKNWNITFGKTLYKMGTRLLHSKGVFLP